MGMVSTLSNAHQAHEDESTSQDVHHGKLPELSQPKSGHHHHCQAHHYHTITSKQIHYRQQLQQNTITFNHTTVNHTSNQSTDHSTNQNTPSAERGLDLLTQYDLGAVEAHLVLIEDAVLAEVVVQVAAVHQVQDEAQLVGRVERVRHTHDERTVGLSARGLTSRIRHTAPSEKTVRGDGTPRSLATRGCDVTYTSHCALRADAKG